MAKDHQYVGIDVLEHIENDKLEITKAARKLK
jgi:hypothetical protein